MLEPVWDFFAWLDAAHGVNLSIFHDEFDRRRFFRGLQNTLWLSAVCIVLSVVVGIVGAWAQGARSRLLRAIVQGYIQFFRNTPPLVQLYFFYFAVGSIMPRVDMGGYTAPMVDNFTWAIISLSFFAGAFNVEIFRSGIEAVPESTREAAESLGFTRLQTYIYVVLPLAIRVSLPALNNNLVNLVKTTTLTYAIAVPELLYVSNQIWSDQFNVREMMNVLLVTYVLIIAGLVWFMHRWERALRIPGYGTR